MLEILQFTVFIVLLHNSGLCIGCIRKRCLLNSTNVSYYDLVSQLLYDKRQKSYQQFNILGYFQTNIPVSSVNGKIIKTKSVLRHLLVKIHVQLQHHALFFCKP
jgi:hypothetical protein